MNNTQKNIGETVKAIAVILAVIAVIYYAITLFMLFKISIPDDYMLTTITSVLGNMVLTVAGIVLVYAFGCLLEYVSDIHNTLHYGSLNVTINDNKKNIINSDELPEL